MQFRLKTLLLAMLGFVLALGLPAMLPSPVIEMLIWCAISLATVAYLIQAIYGRGQRQAFAIGVTFMGLLILLTDPNHEQLVLRLAPLGIYWLRAMPFMSGLMQLGLMFLGGYVARRAHAAIMAADKSSQPNG